jgi:hypothetical protein
MVHAQVAGADVVPPEDVEAHAAAIEEQLIEDEEVQATELEAAEEDGAATTTGQGAATARDRMTRPDA